MSAEPTSITPKRAMPKLWSPDSAVETPALKPLNGGRESASPAQETVGDPQPSSGTRARRPRSTARTYVALPFTRTTLAAAKKAPKQTPSARYSPTIKELPLADRPRERLATHGAQALTTSELLAILIRIGNAERSAVSLGEQLLAEFGSVNEVAAASVEQLSGVKGIGDAKAAQIKAAIEFGKRVSLFGSDERPSVGSPRDAANLVISDLRYLKKETLKSILLDTKSRVIAIKTVSIGDLSSSIVHPREVFKDAVVASAASIIVAHNHPSGDPTPSADDVSVTKRLMAAGEILGIEVLDHIVVGDAEFVSLKERGLI
jgi:DNA repair protein RadC